MFSEESRADYRALLALLLIANRDAFLTTSVLLPSPFSARLLQWRLQYFLLHNKPPWNSGDNFIAEINFWPRITLFNTAHHQVHFYSTQECYTLSQKNPEWTNASSRASSYCRWWRTSDASPCDALLPMVTHQIIQYRLCSCLNNSYSSPSLHLTTACCSWMFHAQTRRHCSAPEVPVAPAKKSQATSSRVRLLCSWGHWCACQKAAGRKSALFQFTSQHHYAPVVQLLALALVTTDAPAKRPQVTSPPCSSSRRNIIMPLWCSFLLLCSFLLSFLLLNCHLVPQSPSWDLPVALYHCVKVTQFSDTH